MSDTSKPAIESVAGYAKDKAPDAARYGVGPSTREGAQAAHDARREHSREWHWSSCQIEYFVLGEGSAAPYNGTLRSVARSLAL